MRSRGSTTYTISLAVVPALIIGLSPGSASASPADLTYSHRVDSAAVSQIGSTLDEMLAGQVRDLQEILAHAAPTSFHQDVVFSLGPSQRSRHRGRVLQRDRPLALAEAPGEFDHLL